MRQIAIRTSLALAALATLGPIAAGDELWFSDQVPSLQAAGDDPVRHAFEPCEVGDEGSPAAEPDSCEDLFTEESLPADGPYDDVGFDCGDTCGESCCEPCDELSERRIITADIELMALRAHFGEVAVGKLAEKYELSERFVVGVGNPKGSGGRVRYWTYDRRTPSLLPNEEGIRFNFDVIDIEGTTRLPMESVEVVIAGGLRWADIKIDIEEGRSRNDMPGGTFGIDLRAPVCRDRKLGLDWYSVTSARWSIFGGDWEGSNDGLIHPTRDDNITVMEISGGFECRRQRNGRDIYARLVFESQNWRSDALGENTGVDSLGFIGPGFSLGMTY